MHLSTKIDDTAVHSNPLVITIVRLSNALLQ